MPIRFACPSCDQSLRAREDKAGKRMRCPKCREVLTVPEEDQPRDKDDEDSHDFLSELVVYDEEVVYERDETAAKTGSVKEFDRRLISVPRSALYAQAALLALVALICVLGGFVIGHFTSSTAEVDNGGPVRAKVEVLGKLSWQASTGELADKGAVVIALPEDAVVVDKLPGAPLRPDHPLPPKDHISLKGIEALGGDYARTNDSGEFALDLLPGAYHVLLVSNRARRPAGEEPEVEHVVSIGKFFLSAHELIGPFKYNWAIHNLGEESIVRHDFGQTGKP